MVVNCFSIYDTEGTNLQCLALAPLLSLILTQIQQLRRFTEARARFYIAEILLAIECLHANDIVYRLVLEVLGPVNSVS